MSTNINMPNSPNSESNNEPRDALYHREYVYNTSSINSNKNKMLYTFLFETFGTFMFIFLSLSNIAIYSLYPESRMTWSGVATSWGLNLLFGIILAKNHSNAYLNPCLALAMFLFRKSINLTELVIYTVAELLGAFLGAAATYGIYYSQYSKLEGVDICGLFATYKNSEISNITALATEFTGTAILVGGIVLITKKETKYNMFCIAALLSLVVLSLGYQTAFSLNWARDFGPRLFITMVNGDCFNYKHYYWIPLVADYSGGIFGALVAHFLV